jgi:hypothetical protein
MRRRLCFQCSTALERVPNDRGVLSPIDRAEDDVEHNRARCCRVIERPPSCVAGLIRKGNQSHLRALVGKLRLHRRRARRWQ